MVDNGATVRCYQTGKIEDARLAYAVIAARHQDKWVWCRHRERDTWEIPGGRREAGESIEEAARRELYEETGALEFRLTPVCPYGVLGQTESYGMLFFAEVAVLGPLPGFEIERTGLFDHLPEALTYPLIQPLLLQKAEELCR